MECCVTQLQHQQVAQKKFKEEEDKEEKSPKTSWNDQHLTLYLANQSTHVLVSLNI